MTALIPLLDALSDVENLSLCDMSWGDLPLDLRQLIKTQYTDINRLEVIMVDFWNTNQMAGLVRSFDKLEQLHLRNMEWHLKNHTSHQIASTTPLKLKSLQVYSAISSEIVDDQILLQFLRGNRAILSVEDLNMQMPVDMLARIICMIPIMLPSMKKFKLELKNRCMSISFAIGSSC